MAHGGHCGGGHHHHHRYRGGSSSNVQLPILLLLLAICFGIVILEANIDGKKPLEGTYTTYPNYLVDETNYLSDPTKIISGLQYLHEKTNVQVVVMTASGSWSDRQAVEKYYEMFDDEAHVLIIVTTSWYSSYDYYYSIGDLANNVIDDRAVNYLLDRINNSRNGEKWENKLIEFTDELLSE